MPEVWMWFWTWSNGFVSLGRWDGRSLRNWLPRPNNRFCQSILLLKRTASGDLVQLLRISLSKLTEQPGPRLGLQQLGHLRRWLRGQPRCLLWQELGIGWLPVGRRSESCTG